MKSLPLNLGMLSMTIAVVFWARWAPQPPVLDIPPATEKVIAFSAKNLQERERGTDGSSGRSVQDSNLEAVAGMEPSNTATHSRLDLNRASAHELESLPGIGAVMAQRVIAFRASVGGFRRVEDLRGVKGIGPKKFDRLKSLVMVSTAKS